MLSKKKAVGTTGTALLAAITWLTGAPWLPTAAKADDPPPTPAQQSRDILIANCARCHGAARPAAGVNVTSRDALVKRKAVLPGDSAHSRLIQVVLNGSMPPGPHKLSADQINTLKTWIDAGATDWAAPATGGTDGTTGTAPATGTSTTTQPFLTQTDVTKTPVPTGTTGTTTPSGAIDHPDTTGQLVATTQPDASGPGYHLIRKVSLPGEGGWDYLYVDSEAHRVYISRSTHVNVINSDNGEVVGDILDTSGVHGIAIDPKSGRGFTSNGRSNTVTIFDTTTLKKIDEVAVGEGPDAILFDPASGRVFTFNGQGQSSTAIDAATGKVVGTIPLPGRPEFAVTDGRGHLYDNIEDKNQIAAINSRTLKVDNTWSLEPGDGPSGIAMDPKSRRLFSVCGNQKLTVMNADNGHIVSTQTIGNGPDACAFDPTAHLVFSPNGRDGNMTILLEMGADQYMPIASFPTQMGARTMALDPNTHHVFVVSARPVPPPAGTIQRRRPNYAPGSFVLLEYGP